VAGYARSAMIEQPSVHRVMISGTALDLPAAAPCD
jgi:hypothetical protein